MDNTCYVEKRHYDALLSAFGRLKIERNNLKKAWTDLKTKTAQFDDRVLEDIHRFDSLAVRYDMEELEETYDVKTHN